jgi:hypothetical protein
MFSVDMNWNKMGVIYDHDHDMGQSSFREIAGWDARVTLKKECGHRAKGEAGILACHCSPEIRKLVIYLQFDHEHRPLFTRCIQSGLRTSTEGWDPMVGLGHETRGRLPLPQLQSLV